MDNVTIIVIGIISVLFGVGNRIAVHGTHGTKGKIYYFFEIWRDAVCYFITAIIVYFFLTIRLPNVKSEGILSTSDFILGIVFLLGILGWLPYFAKNITEGINVIISKVLKK